MIPARPSIQSDLRPSPMIRTLLCAAAVLATTTAFAQQILGTYRSWGAAMHREAGGKVCYAFTQVTGRAGPSSVLVVTHRPQGRDLVGLRIGRAFRRNAKVTVTAGATNLPFDIAEGTAFARSGRAAVAAFRRERVAVVVSATANGRGTIRRTFSLSGFSAAYATMTRACPPAAPRRIGSQSPRKRS